MFLNVLPALFFASPGTMSGASLTVTSTADSGSGTLRQAILSANKTAQVDDIRFQLSGKGPFTIHLKGPLPPLTVPLHINAATQTGYAGTPLIELEGSSAGTNSSGLVLEGGNSTIRALAINGFALDGIVLRNKGGNVVVGNHLGCDLTGKIAKPNANGLRIDTNSSFNTIGGTNTGEFNIISGNANFGILVSGPNASGNVIQANRIGVDRAGTNALPNLCGVVLSGNGASFNTIGGGVPMAGNTISGNITHGVLVTGTSAGNTLANNRVGTDLGGTRPVGNGADGVVLESNLNTIGGTNATLGNLISGNGGNGLSLLGLSAANNTVFGNRFGVSASGLVALGNGGAGIVLSNAPFNSIGCPVPGGGNLISGNGRDGILLVGTNAAGNDLQQNWIGVDSSGAHALPNGGHGISLSDARFNTLGGVAPEARNVIAGNRQDGIHLSGSETKGNEIQGNFVGLDSRGIGAISNGGNGVTLEHASFNNIGGLEKNLGNSISGNIGHGIFIVGSDATGNQVENNRIGTDEQGTSAVGNGGDGIRIDGAPANSIGNAQNHGRNIISGNLGNGITIKGETAADNSIQGNFIGLDLTGRFPLGNRGYGINVIDSPRTSIGAISSAGNTISGNGLSGIRLGGQGGVLQCNFIGTDGSGSIAVPNATSGANEAGILIDGSGNTVGGSVFQARNVVSGNAQNGVIVRGDRNVVIGNFLGTDLTGTKPLGNRLNGLVLEGGAKNNDIGLAKDGSGNFISANGEWGVVVRGHGTDFNSVHSNYIGVNRSGTQPLGNGSGGVLIADQAQHTTIGGPARGDGNIISGNNGPGVEVQDPQTYYNVIQGNLIGTDFTGLRPIPNATIGILIDKRSCLTFIGGENPGTGNRIAFNALGGILIADEGTYGNSIFGNSIALNGGLGINLQLPDESNNLPTPNDSGDSDSGPNHGQNFPEITSVNSAAGSTTIQGSLASQADHTYRIDVYQSATLDPSGFGSGDVYLGVTTIRTDGSGHAGFLFVDRTAVPGVWYTATATEILSGETSEFSRGVQQGPGTTNFIPGISIADGTFSRGREPVVGHLTVSLTGPSETPVQVHYSTVDGTASARVDFVPTSADIVFAPGETNQSVAFIIIDRDSNQPDLEFSIELSAPSNATLLKSRGVVTLTDLRIVNIACPNTNDVAITFTSSAKASYRLEFSESCGPNAQWSPLTAEDATPGTGSPITILDRNVNQLRCRYYRAVLVK